MDFTVALKVNQNVDIKFVFKIVSLICYLIVIEQEVRGQLDAYREISEIVLFLEMWALFQ